jgi:tRNA dimethylallyltransferase
VQTKLVAVVGPTGTGKSDLALHLAEQLSRQGTRAEIVNADSMQLYRGMDIGTAKLSVEERRGFEHHMLDVLSPREESTAAEYQKKARPVIESIQARGAVPILVGGSMLYVAAVLNNFDFPGRDEELRAELESDLENIGSRRLHQRLEQLDAQAAARIDPANGRRVVRALEIVISTGQPFAAALPDQPESWQPVLEIGLNSERSNLTERLAKRVAKMWRLGLVDEAQALIEEGLREGKTASRAIGYSQALGQLDGRLTEQEAQNETTMLTQRYARRQMSWFRRDERIHWLDYQDDSYLATATELTLDWLNEQSK